MSGSTPRPSINQRPLVSNCASSAMRAIPPSLGLSAFASSPGASRVAVVEAAESIDHSWAIAPSTGRFRR
jgi:hypothetical protein